MVKKILIITTIFPPVNSIAATRPLSWANFFAEKGYDVSVLTLQGERTYNSLNYDPFIHEKIKIFGPSSPLKKFRYGKALSWFFMVLLTHLGRLRGHDVVISLHAPCYTHILGRIAHSFNKSLIWVADYKDLWSDNHINNYRGIIKWIIRQFEQILIGRASIMTSVSRPLVKNLQLMLPKVPACVVYNGYEGDVVRCAENFDRSKFVLVYTGTLYPESYDVIPFLDAVSRLKRSNVVHMDNFQLQFIGVRFTEEYMMRLRKNFDLEDLMKIKGPMVSRQECYEIQKMASCLVFFAWNDPRYKGILSGKIFEYMVSGRPVICFSRKRKEVTDLIEKTRIGVWCDSKNVVSIMKCLQRAILVHGNISEYNPDYKEIEKYSRYKQAEKMYHLVEGQFPNL